MVYLWIISSPILPVGGCEPTISPTLENTALTVNCPAMACAVASCGKQNACISIKSEIRQPLRPSNSHIVPQKSAT